MSVVNCYQYYCETEAALIEEDWRSSSQGAPTGCKNHPDHTIDPDSVAIVQTEGDSGPELKTDAMGRLYSAAGKPLGSKTWAVSHNFAKKQAWWQESDEVVKDVLTHVSGYTVYEVSDEDYAPMIDMQAGFSFDEHQILTDYASSHPYMVPKVYVQYGGIGSDTLIETGYTVDTINGTVTFDEALDPDDVVKLSFRVPNTSGFSIQAISGKTLIIDDAEFGWTQDITFPAGGVRVTVYGYIPHPDQVNYPGEMYPYEVPLREYRYPNFYHMFQEGRVHYAPIEPHADGEGTGIASGAAWHDLRWEYMTGTEIYPADFAAANFAPSFNDADGEPRMAWITRIRMDIPDNEPTTGTVAAATYYCLIGKLPEAS